MRPIRMGMPLHGRRLLLASALLMAAGLTTQFALGRKKDKPAAGETMRMPMDMDDHKRAVHALNRLTFGPRPGDVEHVTAIGVEKWIEQQLSPDKIDDSALDARLAPLRTLKMDSRELVENYPPPQVLKAISEGKMSMPSDPKKRAVYESALDTYKTRQQNKAKNDAVQTAPLANGQAANVAANGDAAEGK